MHLPRHEPAVERNGEPELGRPGGRTSHRPKVLDAPVRPTDSHRRLPGVVTVPASASLEAKDRPHVGLATHRYRRGNLGENFHGNPYLISKKAMISNKSLLQEKFSSNLRSSWHMCGTVSMGLEAKRACVDSSFKIFGLERLRVVDLSVCPQIPK